MLKQEVYDTPDAPPLTSPPSADAPTTPAPVDGPSAGKKPKEAWKVKDPLEPKKPPTVFFLFFHSLKAEVLSLFLSRCFTHCLTR